MERKTTGERIREAIEKSTFCYGKKGGQGFDYKTDCKCYCEGRPNSECQAFKDRERFYKRFNDVANEIAPYKFDLTPADRIIIINRIKDEFKDSQWFKDNVKI